MSYIGRHFITQSVVILRGSDTYTYVAAEPLLHLRADSRYAFRVQGVSADMLKIARETSRFFGGGRSSSAAEPPLLPGHFVRPHATLTGNCLVSGRYREHCRGVGIAPVDYNYVLAFHILCKPRDRQCCTVEEDNSFDQHAVAVQKDGGVVGQAPRQLVRIGLATVVYQSTVSLLFHMLQYVSIAHAIL